MNKQNINQHLRRAFFALALAGALAVGAALTLPSADAGKPTDTSYGPGALYQIELVAGDNGASNLPVGQRGAPPQGGGIWLWIALYPDGTADYSGSDCIDGGGTFGVHGAYADKGDATWEYSTTDCSFPCSNLSSSPCIKIKNVQLLGLQTLFPEYQTVITVPSTYGNYMGMLGTFLTLPVEFPPDAACGGTSLVQVAH